MNKHSVASVVICVGLWACSEPEAPAETVPETEAPQADTVPEVESTPPVVEAAFTLVPAPETFFFVDRCFTVRGATREEALDACRRERRNDRWARRWCQCDADHIFEAGPEQLASLFHGCCGALASTPQLARNECQRRIDEDWCLADEQTEPLERIHRVYGPYERHGPFGEFDDEHYRYVALGAPESYWVDETGDPPCFPDGTAIELENGPRNIEDIRVGDRVVAMNDAGELSIVPVIRVKTRRADELVHIDLGSHILRVTPRHPLLVDSQWVLAGEVEPGDQMMTRDGSLGARRVSRIEGAVRVHALTVGAPHTYFADGILAHNY